MDTHRENEDIIGHFCSGRLDLSTNNVHGGLRRYIDGLVTPSSCRGQPEHNWSCRRSEGRHDEARFHRGEQGRQKGELGKVGPRREEVDLSSRICVDYRADQQRIIEKEDEYKRHKRQDRR